jgi:hypothetical protein
MTHKLDIEARLERSLVNQVKAPQLGRKFDAAVWARIEAEAQGATNPVSMRKSSPSKSARWFLGLNAIGMAVTVALVVVFGFQSFADVSMNVPTLNVPTVDVSAATTKQIASIAGQLIAFASLGFGLMFTRFGRWLRAEFT